MKIKRSLSPNYSDKTRQKERIKFVIIHYTGMQSEIASIKRLRNSKAKVSCHYLINRKGEITQMVKENKVAWHAGKSKWRNFNNLNDSSIGIELVNKGHEFGYQNFSKNQITSLISLCKFLKKRYMIKKENFLGHSDIAPLRKIDPGEKFPWKKLSTHKIGKWYKNTMREIQIHKKQMDALFYKNLKSLGYRYFSLSKREFRDKKIVISFQRHFSPDNVNGKIDKKTFKISYFLTS